MEVRGWGRVREERGSLCKLLATDVLMLSA